MLERKILVFPVVLASLLFAGSSLPCEALLHHLPRWIYLTPLVFLLSFIVTEAVMYLLGDPRLPPDGKAILITGCANGIGYELATKLSSEGYQVFAGCRNAKSPGAISLKNLERKSLHVLQMDVTKEEEMIQAEEYVRQNLGHNKLWAVVANAGVQIHGFFEWCDIKDMQHVLDVNLFGVVRTIKTFLPILRGAKGRVIVNTSLAGRFSSPNIVPYSMSKAAAVSLSEGLRRELHIFDVYVSSIEINMYRTNMAPSNTKCLMEMWKKIPEEMRSAYGENRLQEASDTVLNFAALLNPDLTPITDAFRHALAAVHPCPVYKVDRPTYRALFHTLSWLPYEFTDLLATHINSMINYTAKIRRYD